MLRCLLAIALIFVFSGIILPAFAAMTPVDDKEAVNWVRYTVPLPKSIKITGKIAVPADKLAIVYQGSEDMLAVQMMKELKEAIGASGSPASPEFTINLQIGGPDAESLKDLKNSDQAYRMISKDNTGLKLVARTSLGLYYASKTLQQLIDAKKDGSTIVIPALDVTDWPDMQKRGLWGTDNFNHLKWLGNIKMNIMEQISVCGVDDNGKSYARLQDQRDPLVNEGPHYGMEFSPVILHLEQSSQSGMIQKYPHLKGKAEHPGVLCYSQPQVSEIYAEWMVQLVSLPNVYSLDTWMTENLNNKPGCQCDQCKDKDWPVLEAKAILKAWEIAQKKLGRPFKLRVMTAEATEDWNTKVFAILPPEVERAYYHSLLTYNTFRRHQLRKYIADEAKDRWMGVVPNVSATVGFCEPFHGADFIKYRMNEFVDKNLSGLIGYSTPRTHYYRFNVEGSAEWTWNSKGRSTREFALSYAMRHGYKDPEKFVEWSETMGPVGWDVYGSGFPNEELRGWQDTVAVRLKKCTLPKLGFILWDAYPSPWGNIKDEKTLDEDVKNAAKGLKLAREIGIPNIYFESLTIDGLIRSMKALYELKKIVTPAGIAASQKEDAQKWYREYVKGLEQAKDALPKWEETVRTSFEPNPYTKKPVDTINTMLKQMKETMMELGL